MKADMPAAGWPLPSAVEVRLAPLLTASPVGLPRLLRPPACLLATSGAHCTALTPGPAR